MDQYVAILSVSFNKIESGKEGEGNVLVISVLHEEDSMFEVFRVGVFDIGGCADGRNVVVFKLRNVVSEGLSADPHFSEVTFLFNNFLAVVFVGSNHIHVCSNINFNSYRQLSDIST